MAVLYQTTKQNISLHLKNIFKEGELAEEFNRQGLLDSSTGGRPVY